jgi:hypothetical protein
VAHLYAGILGLLAFLTSLVRGLVHGIGIDAVLWTAWCNLWVFAAIGCVTGWMADKIIEDSVRGRIAGELAAKGQGQTAAAGDADDATR